MKDYLVVAMDRNEHFRAYAVRTTQLADEARSRHKTSPTASAALGRALTAGVLMSANLKGDDMLTLRIMGDGPLGAIVVTTDAEGYVRGYVQSPAADLPSKNGKLDVGGIVGRQGQLSVTKNMGLRDPYTGSIELVSGEIGEDIAYYYAKSEQIPSVVALGVMVNTDTTVKAAGGYFIQALPGAPEDQLVRVEDKARSMPNISSLYDKGNKPEEILQMLLGHDLVELDRKQVGFRCRCSREKLEKIMISMGEKEIQDIIDKQGTAEIKCHFCSEMYYFQVEELQRILEKARG